MREGRGGRLRVAAGAFIHDIAVKSAAVELIKANPSIRLELLEREWTAVGAMLMMDRVDFAVFETASLRSMPSLRIETLGEMHGAYYCRANHPLLKKVALQPADVRAYPFVLPGVSHLQVGLVDGLDAGMTLDSATGDVLASIAVSSVRVARDIVAETDAISVGHIVAVREGVAAGRFAILESSVAKKFPNGGDEHRLQARAHPAAGGAYSYRSYPQARPRAGHLGLTVAVTRELARRGSLIHHSDRGVQGKFKRSSQHFDRGGCGERSQAAFGSVWAGSIGVTRSTTGCAAREAATVLGGDRSRHGE